MTNSPITKTLTLEAGDSFQNALLKLSKKLNRIEEILNRMTTTPTLYPTVKTTTLLTYYVPFVLVPRVERETTGTNKNPILPIEKTLRMDPNKSPPPNGNPATTLQHHNKQSTNVGFRNTVQL